MWKLVPVLLISMFLTVWSEKYSRHRRGSLGEKVYVYKDKRLYIVMALVLAVFVGLRTRGNDTYTYHLMFDNLSTGSEAFRSIQWTKLADAPGFIFAGIALKTIGCSFQTYLMVFALFTVCTYLWFIWKYSSDTLFSIFLFWTMGVYIFTMAAIKQTAAVAFLMIATDRLIRKKKFRFFFWVFVSMLFHPYAFMYLILLLLDFCPWTSKTYLLIALSVTAAVGLRYFIEPILSITDMIGAGYTEESFTGEGVNIFRIMVVWVPVILSFLNRNQIKKKSSRVSNIIINASMINAMIMLVGLFGTANYFARLANYFLIFQTMALPWILNLYEGETRHFFNIGALFGYSAYFYYDVAISNGRFDNYYDFMSAFDFLKQLFSA